MNELAHAIIPAHADLTGLTHPSEIDLMRKMDGLQDLVASAARDRAAFRLTHYSQDLAGLFHAFYGNCHVIMEDESLQNARLALIDATRIVLEISLGLLGISTPTKM